ncbi:MAG: single-stranded DNA-binding protein [Clostridia bacterium]|nr:single-stranded DNA-binding protein [Clostridia bacterium]
MVSEKTTGRNPEIIAEKEEEFLKKGKTLFLHSNSKAWISGVLAEDFSLSHTIEKNNKKFYSSVVAVSRESEVVDYVPIIVSERQLPKDKDELKQWAKVSVGGAVKTCKKFNETTKQCFVQASVLEIDNEEKNENIVYLKGFVMIKPRLVQTKSGKKILYVVLEIPLGKGKKSYISCMIWNHAAETAKEEIGEGDMVEIYGSFKSRTHIEEDPNNPGHDIKTEKFEMSVCSYAVLRRKKS